MAERMIPVPESLLRRIPHGLDCDYYATREAERPLPCSCVRAEVDVLLDKPEIGKCCDHPERYATRTLGVEQCRNCGAITGEPVELPMCGDAMNTGSYTYECVEDEGHEGKHQSFSGIWWSR